MNKKEEGWIDGVQSDPVFTLRLQLEQWAEPQPK